MSMLTQQGSATKKFPLVDPDKGPIPALIAVVRRLSIVRSLPEVMEIATIAARTLLRADGITFVLREGDLCHYAEEDAISPLWKGHRFPMSACISGWCMSERQAAVIPDIYADPRIPHDAYRPTFVQSLAMVPVRQDDPIAAMGAYWAHKRHVNASDVELLQSIANAAALAIAYVDLQGRQILNQELQHRVRNMMTVVQAVVSRELRGDPEREANINGRIAALLRADGLLASTETVPGELKEILRIELEPYNVSHFSLDGEGLRVAPERAKALALVTHELATNAVKHGALSVPDGRVSIRWIASGGELHLTWREHGGPPLDPERTRGFGMRFIERVLKAVGGSIRTEWPASGVVHELNFNIATSNE